MMRARAAVHAVAVEFPTRRCEDRKIIGVTDAGAEFVEQLKSGHL
jgi:hypothetical protein